MHQNRLILKAQKATEDLQVLSLTLKSLARRKRSAHAEILPYACSLTCLIAEAAQNPFAI